ncbi:hypothetical protein ACFTSF_37475 [Kribbella sp. NPDC056951]|uniref:hypothetical protein n=1 Tax=Kribbella sp. NPDC056951 TaxID=3345978 RepID=UPI003634410B
MKPWLWIANVVATILVGAAAILQLVDASSPDSSCGPQCDPHGYIVIFTAIPVLVVLLVALSALGSLVMRHRAGFWLELVAAAGCAFELLLLRSLLTVVHAVSVGAVIAATVVLAIVGLRKAPVRRQYRLPEPPYPAA